MVYYGSEGVMSDSAFVLPVRAFCRKGYLMDEMLRASVYLKGILPLMEDLVEYDQAAADAIAGENLVLQRKDIM